MVEDKLSVSNLGFAGFLMLRGFKLVGKPIKGEQGKFAFFFEIEKENHDQLFTEYCSGDFARLNATRT